MQIVSWIQLRGRGVKRKRFVGMNGILFYDGREVSVLSMNFFQLRTELLRLG